jgi:hypothetical protein
MTSQHSIENPLVVENTTWTLETLYNKYNNMNKPKFQRDLKWSVLPEDSKSKKIANYKDFLNFLIEYKNSISTILLGAEIINNVEKYTIIDGNNRINAIINFLICPHLIYSEYYEQLFKIIRTSNFNEKDTLIDFIKNLNYIKLANFRRLNDILPTDLLLSGDLHRLIEDELSNIQRKLISDDGTPFHKNIKLNILILKNASISQYCKMFESINKYTCNLTENELLAAILYHTKINIVDNEIKNHIINEIKLVYDTRGSDEVLNHYEYDISNSIDAFDFMIGLQNYCNKKYSVIHQFEADGLSLFFKLFKIMYNSLTSDKFTDNNIKEFIEKVLFACEILNDAYNKIFVDMVDCSLFNKSSQKNKVSIKKNPMCILLISNISNQHKIDKNKLIYLNRICLIYHFLATKNYIFPNKKELNDNDEDIISSFKVFDCIEYQAGGSYIDNLCSKIFNRESMYIFKITKSKFEELINICMKERLNECTYEDTHKTRKRRKLNLLDEILISNYWNLNAPPTILLKNYSIEHITPFSSRWNDLIDIDRIGNLFPTFVEINTSRGNKDLSIYRNTENVAILQCIKKLLPKKYEEINKYDNKITTIISNEKYNNYCETNEKLLANLLISELFKYE